MRDLLTGGALHRRPPGAWLCAGLLMLGGFGLVGCAPEEGARFNATAPVANARIAPRPGVSPRGAPVAIAQLEGAPDELLQRFGRETNAAAAARDVVNVEPGAAAYLARGYLAAYPAEGGTIVVCILDLYDKGRRRVQRLEDFIVVKGAAANPWAVVDAGALAALAGRTAGSLAAALTNTPEAIAGAGKSAVVAMDPEDEAPRTLR